VRYRLPTSLRGLELQRWDSRGLTGLKDGVGPLDPSKICTIINTVLTELHKKLSVPLLTVAGLNGANSARVAKSKKIILVGASHARRVAEMMTERGITTHLLETGHWRATKQEVSKLLADIKAAMGDLPSDEVAIVLFMLDNAYYKARAEDGNLIPHSRDITGRYHIYGDVMGAPMETNKQVLLQLVPLIKALQDYDKIVMTPLPRYLWSSCCDDPDHAPNIASVDHVPSMLAGLAGVQKLWRGMLFRERLRNTKVCNVGPQLEEIQWWLGDPVHPTTEGYTVVVDHIIRGLTSLEEKRLLAEQEEASSDDPGKRGREHDDTGSTPGPKRPQWDPDCYAARQDSLFHRRGGGGSGRGYFFSGNRGWPRRGGGGRWPRYGAF
jgi:hypothetical protein